MNTGWTLDFSLYTITHLFSVVKNKINFTLVTGSTLPKTELLPKKVISGVSSLPNTIMLLNEVGSLDKNTFFLTNVDWGVYLTGYFGHLLI